MDNRVTNSVKKASPEKEMLEFKHEIAIKEAEISSQFSLTETLI